MKNFEYARPTSLAGALELLAEERRSEVLAGGTDLLSLMKAFVVEPDRLVSLGGVAELAGIREEGDHFWIGAMTSLDALLAHEPLGTRFPALHDAARGIRGQQLRAMGTLGGELLQRPRCPYFRRGMGLLPMKDGRPLAEAGEQRSHSIFGHDGPSGDARYVSPSSLAPALIALEAHAEVAALGDDRQVVRRSIALEDLFTVPDTELDREFSIGPGRPHRLLAGVRIKKGGFGNATYEVRQRTAVDQPEAAAAASVTLDGDRIGGVRLVLGQVAPVPWRVEVPADAYASGLDEAAAARIAAAAVAGATPLPDNTYKVELSRVAAGRALLLAASRAFAGRRGG